MIPPYQQRVIDEKKELDDRIEKLVAFQDTDVFKALDPVDSGLLIMQANAMQTYSDLLSHRILRFGLQ